MILVYYVEMSLSINKVTRMYLPISLSSWIANGVSENICKMRTSEQLQLSYQAGKCGTSPIIWTHLAVLASWYHWKTEVFDFRCEGLVQQDVFYVEVILHDAWSSHIMQKLNSSCNTNGSRNPLWPFQHFTFPPLCKSSQNISWESHRYSVI